MDMKSHLKILGIALLLISLFYLVSYGQTPSSKTQANSNGATIPSLIENFSEPQEDVPIPEKNWEIDFFNDEFNNKTNWPYIRTTKALDVTCELVTSEGFKPTKTDLESVFLRFNYTKKGRPCISIVGSNMYYIFSSLSDIPVNIIYGEKSEHFIVYGTTSNSSKNLLLVNEKDSALKVLNSFLENNGKIKIQLRKKTTGLYTNPYDKVYSFTVETAGIKKVYDEYVKRQKEWEKTLPAK